MLKDGDQKRGRLFRVTAWIPKPVLVRLAFLAAGVEVG